MSRSLLSYARYIYGRQTCRLAYPYPRHPRQRVRHVSHAYLVIRSCEHGGVASYPNLGVGHKCGGTIFDPDVSKRNALGPEGTTLCAPILGLQLTGGRPDVLHSSFRDQLQRIVLFGAAFRQANTVGAINYRTVMRCLALPVFARRPAASKALWWQL